MDDHPSTVSQDRLTRYYRKAVLFPGILVTIVALVLFFIGIPGSAVYLFVCGLSGGSTLIELTEALERRDTQKEQRRMLLDNEKLRDQVRALGQQMLSMREPALRSAILIGSSFAMVNNSPDSEEAVFLGVSDDIRAARDANDVHGICRALETRWGSYASESFLLGRQITAGLGRPQVFTEDETRTVIRERLQLRTDDNELVTAVDQFLGAQNDPKVLLRYMGQLLSYISMYSATVEARKLRSILTRSHAGVEELPDSSADSKKRDLLRHTLEILVNAGVHEKDADVLLFWGVVNDDQDTVASAIAKHADPTVTDIDIFRRYRDLIESNQERKHDGLNGLGEVNPKSIEEPSPPSSDRGTPGP